MITPCGTLSANDGKSKTRHDKCTNKHAKTHDQNLYVGGVKGLCVFVCWGAYKEEIYWKVLEEANRK